jgi:hypothetical protein
MTRYYTASRLLYDIAGHTIGRGVRYIRQRVWWADGIGPGRERWVKLCGDCAIKAGAPSPGTMSLRDWLTNA